MKSFNIGDVVVFDPSGFNPEFWGKLPQADRLRYYGDLGYGADQPVYFVFITEVNQAPGHCVLINLGSGRVEWMRHTQDFRLVTEEEF